MDEELRTRVCRLVAGIVVSDDDLDEKEDVFIDRLLKEFDIPLDQRATIFPIIDRDEAAAEIKTLPAEVQTRALELLIRAAAADGKVAAEEAAYLDTVADALGIDRAVIKARLDAALAG